MMNSGKMKESLKTLLIIVGIYLLFILYLLFVSDRVEKLDNKSFDKQLNYSLKIGE